MIVIVIVNTFNTEVTDTANEILGKHCTVKKPWVINDVLDLCDKCRELKKKNVTEGAKEYRAINQEVKKAMKKAKENWIDEQCQSIEDNLKKNNSKKAYQLVKDLTSTKKVRTSTIQNKDGKSLTEDQEILKRWTEYCSELYNYTATGDSGVLQVPTATNNNKYPILREEVEVAVKSLKKGKSAGVDNIPGELVQAGGEAMISALLTICNKVRQTGEWPTTWTQSLIITLPKKGNLHYAKTIGP